MTPILFNLCDSPVFLSPESGSKKKSLFTSMFSAEKSAFFALFYTNWEEIESLKKEKSPGIVLEFCFPISVQTLYKLSTFFLKIHIQKI